MNEISIAKRLTALILISVGAVATFAFGLALLNVRNDWAFGLGVFLCFAAPIAGGIGLWSMLRKDASL